jgi:hypothetical protein
MVDQYGFGSGIILSKRFFPWSFRTKMLYIYIYIYCFPMHATYPAHQIFLNLINLTAQEIGRTTERRDGVVGNPPSVPEILGSNLGPETGYSDLEVSLFSSVPVIKYRDTLN